MNVGKLVAGSSRNVICESAHMEMEVRGMTAEANQYMYDYACRIIENAAQMHGCTSQIRLMGAATNSLNTPELMDRMKKLCEERLQLPVVYVPEGGVGGSEDYSCMSERVKEHGGQSCYFLNLSKCHATLHNDRFDFDEKAKEIFYKELDNHLYDDYKSFASNPLLLNIMLLTFQKHASIPERLNDFYDEAFVTLFNVHDATKDSYVRDIRSGLGCEDFKLIFSYICFKSYFNGEFQFSESRLRFYIQQAKEKFDRFNFTVENFQEDLTQSVCMLVKEGGTYRFSHRSFQEYFAAWYTCKLVDDVQAKLLLNWIQESDSVLSDSYFTMLFDLQSEKVNKIILCPILKEIKKLYLQYGFSIELLNILFKGMKFTKRLNGDETYCSTSLTIKNQYLCYGLMLNSRLNMFQYLDNDDKQEKQIFEKMEKYMVNKNHKRSTRILSATFDEVLEVLKPEELLEHLDWFQNQIEFALQIVEKYDDRKISRKKKVSTILEEL